MQAARHILNLDARADRGKLDRCISEEVAL
jgi:hypothetical protein